MGLKKLKVLTGVVGAALVGLVVCLVMTAVIGVREHQARQNPAPISIPLPATGS